MDHVPLLLYQTIQALYQAPVDRQSQNTNVLVVLQLLLFLMLRTVPVDYPDIQKPGLVAFPGIAVNRNPRYLKNSLRDIPRLLLELPHRILLIIFAFEQTCWKFDAEVSYGWPKVCDEHESVRAPSALNDGYDFYSVDGCPFLFPLRSKDSLVVFDLLLTNCVCYMLNTDPLLLDGDRLGNDPCNRGF